MKQNITLAREIKEDHQNIELDQHSNKFLQVNLLYLLVHNKTFLIIFLTCIRQSTCL